MTQPAKPPSGVQQAPTAPTPQPTPVVPQPQAPPPTPAPLPFEITPPSRDQYLKMLIYGPYGVGKTFLAASTKDVTRMRDILFLDCESGTMTLADFRTDVDTIKISRYGQFARVFEYLRVHCRLRDENNSQKLKELELRIKPGVDPKSPPRKYRTVVIDSLTEVQKYCMYQLLGIDIGKTALDSDVAPAQIQDWGRAADMMRLLIRSFRDLPMNVIFVTSVNESQDESNKIHLSPALSGKMSSEVQGFLDVVGLLMTLVSPEAVGSIKRRLFLRPSDRYAAKDRYHVGNAIAYIDDPTIDKFLTAGQQ